MDKKIKEIEGWQIRPVPEGENRTLYHTTQAILRNPRSGEEQIYNRFSFGDWVNILAITPEKKIILVRQFRFGTERMEWELPGGRIEQGEEPLAAGVRELEEETGYIGQSEIIGSISPNPAIQDNSLYTVLVKDAEKKGTLHFDTMEDIETHLVSCEQIIAMLQKGEINHGFTYNALMHWTLRRGIFTLNC